MELLPGDKLKYIGCEIIYRETCKLVADSPFRIDIEFLKKGLHDLETHEMVARLQKTVDAVSADDDYKAIILGYARCNDGLVGLSARSIPLVIPKAHDCITFFFGSRGAYQAYFDAHPGTYYHTTGWLERNDAEIEGQPGVMRRLGLDQSYEQMVEKYGKEEADFIMETVGGGLEHYDRHCYLQMGVMDETPFIEESRRRAEEQGWIFELRKGDWTLLEKLFYGRWDDDFLIVPPNRRIIARNDSEVLGLEGEQ